MSDLSINNRETPALKVEDEDIMPLIILYRGRRYKLIEEEPVSHILPSTIPLKYTFPGTESITQHNFRLPQTPPPPRIGQDEDQLYSVSHAPEVADTITPSIPSASGSAEVAHAANQSAEDNLQKRKRGTRAGASKRNQKLHFLAQKVHQKINGNYGNIYKKIETMFDGTTIDNIPSPIHFNPNLSGFSRF